MWDGLLHIHVIIKWQLSKQGIRWQVSNDLIAGSRFDPLRLSVLKTSADKFLVVNWSQAQDYFLTHTAHEISCAYEQAVGLQARKVSLFTGREGSFYSIIFLLDLTTEKKIWLCLAWSRVGHALRPILISDWSKFDRWALVYVENLCSIWKLVYW